MIIQNLNNNLILLPVKDCRGVSLISYTDVSMSLEMLLDRLLLTGCAC